MGKKLQSGDQFLVHGYSVKLRRRGSGYSVLFRDDYPTPAKLMVILYLKEEGFFRVE